MERSVSQWGADWFDATAGRRFATKEECKQVWQAARVYYQLTGTIRLFEGRPLRFWSWVYRLWKGWTDYRDSKRKDA